MSTAGRAHIAAVRARLVDQLPAGVAILDGDERQRALPAGPFVVLFPDTGRPTATRLHQEHTHVESVIAVQACGETTGQAEWCAAQVSDALAGWRPTLTGRTAWRVTQDYAQPVRLDDDIPERPVQFAALGFRVRSQSAS